jgi:hypothetical protein
MTQIKKKWKEALDANTNPMALIQYVKEARSTLQILGTKYDRQALAKNIINESDHEGSPVELLRQLIEGIEEMERLSFRG